MNTYLLTCAAALALGAAACGDDEKKTDTTSTTDATTSDTTTSATDTATDTTNAQTSPVTGVVKPASPDPEPTANPSCAADNSNPDYTNTTGFVYPWEGATVDGDDYTCNGCKTGDAKMQGEWRVHGFENPDGSGNMDYDFPDPDSDYAEVLAVDGNTFEVRIHDAKAPSGDQDGVYRGFYFCAEKPEQGGAHLFWIVTDADAGSTAVGDVFETDVVQGGQGSVNNILIYWYDAVGGTTSKDYTYCRIGTKNPDNDAQTCTNTIE